MDRGRFPFHKFADLPEILFPHPGLQIHPEKGSAGGKRL